MALRGFDVLDHEHPSLELATQDASVVNERHIVRAGLDQHSRGGAGRGQHTSNASAGIAGVNAQAANAIDPLAQVSRAPTVLRDRPISAR